MNRFAKSRKSHILSKEILLPILGFLVVLFLFLGGLNSVTQTTQKEQFKATKQAIIRAAVHCYAVEGAYPPTLSYLEEQYGLLIDYDKYMVDYSCFASNLMPDITILELTSNK